MPCGLPRLTSSIRAGTSTIVIASLPIAPALTAAVPPNALRQAGAIPTFLSYGTSTLA